MLAEVGVASQPSNMSFSVSDGRGGFEWATHGPRALFAAPGPRLDPRFHRMLLDLGRFNRDLRKLIGRRAEGPSLRRFLAEGGYSEYFVERLLVPQASAIWSADPEQMWSFPAASWPNSSTTTACCSCAAAPPGARSAAARAATWRR